MINLRQQNTELQKEYATLENETRVLMFDLKRQLNSRTSEMNLLLEQEKEKHFEDANEKESRVRILETMLDESNRKLNDALTKLEYIQVDLDV
jgi:hypothetical protein